MEHGFNEVCFHYNLIHGVIFVLILEGFLQSNIALDIDYIEKWFKTEGGEIFFVI